VKGENWKFLKKWRKIREKRPGKGAENVGPAGIRGLQAAKRERNASPTEILGGEEGVR